MCFLCLGRDGRGLGSLRSLPYLLHFYLYLVYRQVQGQFTYTSFLLLSITGQFSHTSHLLYSYDPISPPGAPDTSESPPANPGTPVVPQCLWYPRNPWIFRETHRQFKPSQKSKTFGALFTYILLYTKVYIVGFRLLPYLKIFRYFLFNQILHFSPWSCSSSLPTAPPLTGNHNHSSRATTTFENLDVRKQIYLLKA